MKIKIEFTPNTIPVPFNYITNINGYLHKVIGNNNKYHDSLSLYSTSFLHGGVYNKKENNLNFPNGAIWYVSSPDKEFITSFIYNIYNNIDFIYGMKLNKVGVVKRDIKPINNGITKDLYVFPTKSPILLKRKDYTTNKNIYYTFEDDNVITNEIMKNLIIKKANTFGLTINENDFEIGFDTTYNKKKIKWVDIKSVKNKACVCPIKIKTNNKKIVEFIYDIGVGHSTGSGLGFLL